MPQAASDRRGPGGLLLSRRVMQRRLQANFQHDRGNLGLGSRPFRQLRPEQPVASLTFLCP